VCTEFWKFTFSKGVDNLRTNNAGTFIVTDEAFKFIARVSNRDNESREYKDKIKCYESFVIGMLRGALINLGYDQVPPQVQTVIKDARLQVTITVQIPVSNSANG
jgi:trafficking protein particle complex subunit 6